MLDIFNKDKKGTIKKFTCAWCGTTFDLRIVTSEGDKRSKVSTQVKCPGCKTFLPNDSGV